MSSIAQVVGAQLATTPLPSGADGVHGTPEVPPERRTRTRTRENAIVIGAAQRQVWARAKRATPKLTATELHFLWGVVDLVATYSRLEDRYSHDQIAEAAGIGGTDKTRRRKTSATLAKLRDLGLIRYEPGRGRSCPSLIGLPYPAPVQASEPAPPEGLPVPPEARKDALGEARKDALSGPQKTPSGGRPPGKPSGKKTFPPNPPLFGTPSPPEAEDHRGGREAGADDDHAEGEAVLDELVEALGAQGYEGHARSLGHARRRNTRALRALRAGADERARVGWDPARLAAELVRGRALAEVSHIDRLLASRLEAIPIEPPAPDPPAHERRACPDCADRGVVELDDGTAARCRCMDRGRP